MKRLGLGGRMAPPLIMLFAALLPWPAVRAGAHPLSEEGSPRLHQRIDDLLKRNGLSQDKTALMLYSTRSGKVLYSLRPEAPMIAASNAKLATTFAALQTLTPNYRWKTTFYLTEEHDDPAAPTGQGLLVKGGGDPSLSSEDLAGIALQLKAKGLNRLDGPLYYDDSLFDEEKYPPAWGGAAGQQPWFAPISPFILDKNAIHFVISGADRAAEIQVLPQLPADFIRVVSRLKPAKVKGMQIYVEQKWDKSGGRFLFRGRIPPGRNAYPFSMAVTHPVNYFFHHLRANLQKLGVKGEMPLRPLPEGEMARKLIHTHMSKPLRELLPGINKESNNLAAEVIMRTLAGGKQGGRISGRDGVNQLRRAIELDFPRFRDQVNLADGAGLNRETRMSAAFLVELLRRVREQDAFRAEYVSSLSLGGWDGTLQFRQFPSRMWGHVRAKSGTLKGVQNLSGYLRSEKDVIIFSFLINHPGKKLTALQRAQDAVLTGIFNRISEMESEPEQLVAKKESTPGPAPGKSSPVKAEPAPAALPPAAVPLTAVPPTPAVKKLEPGHGAEPAKPPVTTAESGQPKEPVRPSITRAEPGAPGEQIKTEVTRTKPGTPGELNKSEVTKAEPVRPKEPVKSAVTKAELGHQALPVKFMTTEPPAGRTEERAAASTTNPAENGDEPEFPAAAPVATARAAEEAPVEKPAAKKKTTRNPRPPRPSPDKVMAVKELAIKELAVKKMAPKAALPQRVEPVEPNQPAVAITLSTGGGKHYKSTVAKKRTPRHLIPPKPSPPKRKPPPLKTTEPRPAMGITMTTRSPEQESRQAAVAETAQPAQPRSGGIIKALITSLAGNAAGQPVERAVFTPKLRRRRATRPPAKLMKPPPASNKPENYRPATQQ